jgi:hypothetical protein
MADLRTPAEKRYDELKSGQAYVKPQPHCLTCGDDGDCPDCDVELEIAKEADRIIAEDRAMRAADDALAATADDAPTMREKVEILFSAGRVPDGDHIFDLVLEDSIAHYAWLRCVDWVLWRQAHGKPVKVLGEPDRTSAAIDARYDAARDFARPDNCSPYSTERDVALVCAGQIIKQWERTPAEQAEIAEDTDAIIKLLEDIEAHFDAE